MSTSLNRRALVAGATSLPAFAVPAAAQSFLHSPDQELLELGAELDKVLVGKYIPKAKEQRQESLALDAAVEQEYRDLEADGVTLDEWQRPWVRLEVVHRHSKDALLQATIDDFWDEVNPETDDLCDEILAIEPKTLEGLRVHARAVSACCQHLWDGDESDAANFVDRVCRMLGTTALKDDIGRDPA